MLTSWLWIELRGRFLWMIAVSVALNFIFAWTQELSSGAELLASSVGEWHSRAGKVIYFWFVVVLAHSGITASRGLRREVLQSLPVTGRGWVRSQWRVVGTLAVILALVFHGATTVFWWGVTGEPVLIRQSLIHVARWAVGAWFVFGVAVAADAEETTLERVVWVFSLMLLTTFVFGIWPLEVFEWGPSPTGGQTPWDDNLGPPILAVIFGWVGARVAARRIDRGE